ncbi:centrosomal protein of 68 kDa isoform X3 [Apus apus]|uniref:centrosomal protein of 68 kDa isoform X3 n=1 Tax=Apus apus TaxID=8895 RepID=UPI0021F8F02D|nr:centrosomal protein of 68 kDa isoform X3 [Apus apus]
MAVDVGKSLSEASLSGKSEGNGRWDCTEVEGDYPELADSLHRLLGAEEAKPCPQGTESVAMSGHSHLATDVTQGGSSYHQEVSSASASRFPRARASLSETEALIYSTNDSGDVPHHVSHQFLSSEEQQVKASGHWELTSSPPSQLSSAEETLLAGSCHHARAGRQSRSLGAQSSFSSTSELLRPQTPFSPENALQSRSVSSFSTLSSEENGLSKKLSRCLLASTDMPSPVASKAWWGAAEGRMLRPHKNFSPLRDDRPTVEHTRKMSSYQADYWACAIPDSLPPSPDRQSPHWNPHKEYEDLLDYAYPLKPRYKLGKMFCCQLEELIRWLYNVAEITDSWVPVLLDAEGVKASLHRCLEFRKDVADHRSLTESVLERGEALLDCMASNSPALKDTLGLIAKQSEELETHAEHLYESVLASVGPVQGEDRMEDEGL